MLISFSELDTYRGCFLETGHLLGTVCLMSSDILARCNDKYLLVEFLSSEKISKGTLDFPSSYFKAAVVILTLFAFIFCQKAF